MTYRFSSQDSQKPLRESSGTVPKTGGGTHGLHTSSSAAASRTRDGGIRSQWAVPGSWDDVLPKVPADLPGDVGFLFVAERLDSG